MRILLVEDDLALSASVSQAIRESGFSVDVAHTGPEGLSAALAFDYALVVLDLLLPGKHGLEVLKDLRRAKPRLPVLILSALDEVGQRVDGLDRGADDYLAKPFALEELLARVRSLLRRSTLEAPDAHVRAGDLDLDLARRRVRRGDREIELTPREYSILVFLMSRRGKPVSREQIGAQVVDRDFEATSNAIDVSICGLRAKLGAPDPIRTVRGVGYRLEDTTSAATNLTA